MRLSNYTPGFVVSYDAATRLCRVRIPGLTDGSDVLPLAMLSYPIGDKSEHTELRILPGDRVWLDFVNGDARYPIITGFRPKETDNAIAWRRWHHENIELLADEDMQLIAASGKLVQRAGGDVRVSAGTEVTVDAGGNVRIKAAAQVIVEAGSTMTLKAPSITLQGTVNVTGALAVQGLLTYVAGISGTGPATSNGVNVGGDHTHPHGEPRTGPPG